MYTLLIADDEPLIRNGVKTGHEDFQYAQKSVGLGVKNYILKPIGAESLYKEMKEICEKLHIENSQRQYIQSMKNQLRQSLPVLQEQTLNTVISGCIWRGQKAFSWI